MGRPGGGDSSVVLHSSIALLQERFKQLERAKEKRERMAMAAAGSSERQMTWLFCQYPDLIQLPPPPPPPPVPAPHRRRLLHAKAGSPSSAASTSSSWPPAQNVFAGDDDEVDAVDTSLHL